MAWSRGTSHTSPMLSLRYWQKQCSHSFVLYCFQHCQTHHNAVTRYSIILGDASKWTYGTYIYASVSFPLIKTQITIWIGFHQTLNHHICNLTSVYNRFHTFYQLLNCWKVHDGMSMYLLDDYVKKIELIWVETHPNSAVTL